MEGIWVYGFGNGGNAITNLTIHDTTIDVAGGNAGQAAAGIIGDAASNAVHSGWHITDNTITIAGNGSTPMVLQDVSASEFSGNTITNSSVGNSTIWSSERWNLANIIFSDNHFSGGSKRQIYFLTDYNQISGGTSIPVESSVVATNITGVTFHGNTFSDWGQGALMVGEISTGKISDFNITNNTFGMTTDTDLPIAIMSGTLTLTGGSNSSEQNIFNVSGDAKIQKAINAAFAGDTINVATGDYTENLIVDKSLTIHGEGVGTVITGSIKSTGDSVAIQNLKVTNNNEDSKSDSTDPLHTDYDYGVWTSAGQSLTLTDVTVDVLHNAILMTGDSATKDTALTINHSIIKGYGALVIDGAINSTGAKSAVVTIHDTSLTGSTSYSGSWDDFAVITTTNTKNVNIIFTGTSSVANEYTNNAEAKERLMSFYSSSNIIITRTAETVIYSNAGNSKVNDNALFVSAYGSSANTVEGQVVARYVSNTAEFEAALASEATTPIIVGRYETTYLSTPTPIETTKNNTLKTGVKLIIEDHNIVTIMSGHTLINNGSILIESNVTLTNNGTLQSIDVAGILEYGQMLTAEVKGITNAGTPTYQWKRAGVSIDGATALTYTLVSADVGATITATATLSGITGSITSAGKTVATKTITVTADAKSKVYGDADPALTYTLPDGSLIGGDVLTGSLSRADGANVGTYAISSSLVNSNYVITFVPANLTITKAPLTITADAKSKVYGDADPGLTYTTSLFVNSETTSVLTGSLSRADGANVGTYAISSTLANSNYDITFVLANLTITAKPITVTADTKEKGFGLSDPALTYTFPDGSLVGSDAFTGYLTRVSGETLGTYAINQGTVAISSNYTITYVSALFSILDITAPSIISKTPSASAVGIDPAANITVVFNENVLITNAKVTLQKGSSAPVSTVVTGTETVIINPAVTLDNNSTYTIALTSVTDTAGNIMATTSWTFTTSASYSMTLTTGWNLISLPVVPTNTLASSVLGTLNDATKIETVWKYDPILGTWGAYHPGNPGTSSFSTMTAGEGYWINYLSGTAGTIAGTGNLFQEGNSTPPQKSLAAGWNLIGYYQLENIINTTATKALSTITGQWTQLRTYSNTDKQFQAVTGNNDMKPGEGYWIFMKSSSYAPYLYGPGDSI